MGVTTSTSSSRHPLADANGHAPGSTLSLDRPGPPQVSVLWALRRYWPLAVLPAVFLVLAAAVATLQRQPTYTAYARMSVGRIDVSSPGALAGFASATEALAAAYSRAVDSWPVVTPIAEQLELEPPQVAARLGAAYLPESSTFTIEATGGSTREAVQLANLATDSLVRYVNDLNRNNPDGDRLYKEFKRISLELSERYTAQTEAGERYESNPSRRTWLARERAETEVQATTMRLDAVRRAYDATQQGQASASNLQTLVPATASSTASDRGQVMQRMVFFALVAGLAIGIALAMAQARQVARRHAS
jgi:capsular polysaccharide biosynthesis protein